MLLGSKTFEIYETVCIALLCLVVSIGAAHAKPHKLLLAVNSPGTQPHLYFNQQTGQYEGIIADLLAPAEKDGVLTIEYVDSHRSRSEAFVYEGKVDMFFSSLDWVAYPDRVIATDTIFDHTSYLYATKPFAEDFALTKQTKARVCTRRGFTYPTLDPLFTQGKLKRIDSTSQVTMLNMLKLGRCDMTEISHLNALTLIKSEAFAGTDLFRFETPTSVVSGVLLMHPSKREQRDIINRYIKAFIQSGQFEVSLNKHTSRPKLASH